MNVGCLGCDCVEFRTGHSPRQSQMDTPTGCRQILVVLIHCSGLALPHSFPLIVLTILLFTLIYNLCAALTTLTLFSCAKIHLGL